MFRWLRRRKVSYKDVATFGVASLAEEHWRRKMILAAHKLQQAQRSLACDLEQIESLHGLLESSGLRIEQLAAGLSETQGAVAGLGEQLEEHKDILRSPRPRPAVTGLSDEDDTAELFAQSEAAVMRLVERIQELRGRQQPASTPPNARVQELARLVSEQEERIAELEADNEELAGQLAAPEEETTDAEGAEAETVTKIRALEACLRQLEMEKVELETRHVQQMIDLADQTRSRIRALELEIVRRGDKLRALEQMHGVDATSAPLAVPEPFEPEEPTTASPWAASAHPSPPPALPSRPRVTREGLIDSDLFLDEVEGRP